MLGWFTGREEEVSQYDSSYLLRKRMTLRSYRTVWQYSKRPTLSQLRTKKSSWRKISWQKRNRWLTSYCESVRWQMARWVSPQGGTYHISGTAGRLFQLALVTRCRASNSSTSSARKMTTLPFLSPSRISSKARFREKTALCLLTARPGQVKPTQYLVGQRKRTGLSIRLSDICMKTWLPISSMTTY